MVTSPCGLPSVTWRGELKIVGAVFLDGGAMLFRLGDGLPLLELVHHVLQHLGMAQQYSLMMRSISPRCAAVKDCACAEPRRAAPAGPRTARQRHGRRSNVIIVRPSVIRPRKALCGGLRLAMSSALTQPGEPTGKARLGAGGDLARGLDVAAHEGRLRGGEIGVGEVALLAIGHRQLAVAVGRFRLARHRRLQQRHRLVDARRDRAWRPAPAPA